jgi:hypothetical protein
MKACPWEGYGTVIILKECEMHIEFLIEDQSGTKAMEILLPKLLNNKATYRIHDYKGIGRLPKNLRSKNDAKKRMLLDQLPRLLRGYGRVPNLGYVIIICDLDDNDEQQFLSKLNDVLNGCNPKPNACFCLAIEEFEAWYLGDLDAIRKAYPKANDVILNGYKNDSICGTWELLADAVCKGGSRALKKEGWQAVGKQKSVWAVEISPNMNVDNNISPSFKKMLSQLRSITAQAV